MHNQTVTNIQANETTNAPILDDPRGIKNKFNSKNFKRNLLFTDIYRTVCDGTK